jgi:serine/threonine-protein kinase
MAATRRSEDLIGGRYRLESTIASGGMADVWLATDLHLRREVAVKLLRASVADDHTVAERFRREARALAQLTHPNIVPVYDCIEEEDGQVALVMRLIRGNSLRQVLDDAGTGNRAGQISAYLTVHIGRSIAAALARAHSRNILHRDIKPGNILITKGGEILLTDFGIAKPLRSTEEDGTDLTRADIMMGTVKYLSPEQVQGRELDERADIYSLGIVLYECLAGEVPFHEENNQATAIARLERDPTPLDGIRADVPSTVINVIHKMLRRKPDARYSNCLEVVQALDDAMNNLHDSVTPVAGVAPSLPRSRTTSIDPLMTPKLPRTLAVVPDSDTPVEQPLPRRDPTPRGGTRPKTPLPPTRQTSTRRNYIPVVFLLVAALVMSMFLWNGLQNTKSSSGTLIDNVEVVPVTLLGVRSYDPGGDDGEENDSLLPGLLDNNPSTMWTSVCYGSKYFGSKAGLGLIMQLSGIGIGTLKANFANGPWNAEIYVSTAEAIPATLPEWGLRVGTSFSEKPGLATFDVKTPARNVLVYLREMGRSPNCSNKNPYQSMMSDLSFTSAK